MTDTNDQVMTNPQDMVDAALTPLTPLSLPTEPVAQPVIQDQIPAVSEPTVLPPEPVVKMGDDTPLAFATPTDNSTAVPPVAPPLQSAQPTPEPAKKKSKLNLILAGLTSVFVVLTLISVFQYITTGKIPLIAGVLDDYKYNTGKTGGTGVVGKDKDEDEDVIADGKAMLEDKGILKDAADKAEYDRITNAQLAAGTAYNKYITENNLDEGKCYVYDPQIGGNRLADNPDPKCTQAQAAATEAYAKAIAITATMCDQLRIDNWDADKTVATDKGGLCFGGSCTAPIGCRVEKVSCKAGGKVGVACNETIVSNGSSATVDNDLQCGSQQLDVICDACGSQPVAFANKITGIACKTTTTEESTPTMACTGLTSVPALTPAPLIGSKLVFTCAGSVTPSTAGTLSYKFRYNINSGSYTTLANKTTTTAELTVAACGTYSVECQACATLNGVLTCDPTWTGATQ